MKKSLTILAIFAVLVLVAGNSFAQGYGKGRGQDQGWSKSDQGDRKGQFKKQAKPAKKSSKKSSKKGMSDEMFFKELKKRLKDPKFKAMLIKALKLKGKKKQAAPKKKMQNNQRRQMPQKGLKNNQRRQMPQKGMKNNHRRQMPQRGMKNNHRRQMPQRGMQNRGFCPMPGHMPRKGMQQYKGFTQLQKKGTWQGRELRQMPQQKLFKRLELKVEPRKGMQMLKMSPEMMERMKQLMERVKNLPPEKRAEAIKRLMNDPKYKEMFGNMFKMQPGKAQAQPGKQRFEFKVLPEKKRLEYKIKPGKGTRPQMPKISPEMMELMKKRMERLKALPPEKRAEAIKRLMNDPKYKELLGNMFKRIAPPKDAPKKPNRYELYPKKKIEPKKVQPKREMKIEPRRMTPPQLSKVEAAKLKEYQQKLSKFYEGFMKLSPEDRKKAYEKMKDNPEYKKLTAEYKKFLEGIQKRYAPKPEAKKPGTEMKPRRVAPKFSEAELKKLADFRAKIMKFTEGVMKLKPEKRAEAMKKLQENPAYKKLLDEYKKFYMGLHKKYTPKPQTNESKPKMKVKIVPIKPTEKKVEPKEPVAPTK
ncbi:MAG: hypothetical protein K8S87_12595 [Planctomycetes bacterium]|nr:hypothetical protein [Planctomycetota bacterium]